MFSSAEFTLNTFPLLKAAHEVISLYLVFMYSSPHSYPTFVQPPPPNNTDAKTNINALGDIDRYPGSSSFSGNFHHYVIHSATPVTRVHSNMAPAEIAVPYLKAPLFFPTGLCSGLQLSVFFGRLLFNYIEISLHPTWKSLQNRGGVFELLSILSSLY